MDVCFSEFSAFFLPVVCGDIDWERKLKFLDKELLRTVRSVFTVFESLHAYNRSSAVKISFSLKIPVETSF